MTNIVRQIAFPKWFPYKEELIHWFDEYWPTELRLTQNNETQFYEVLLKVLSKEFSTLQLSIQMLIRQWRNTLRLINPSVDFQGVWLEISPAVVNAFYDPVHNMH